MAGSYARAVFAAGSETRLQAAVSAAKPLKRSCLKDVLDGLMYQRTVSRSRSALQCFSEAVMEVLPVYCRPGPKAASSEVETLSQVNSKPLNGCLVPCSQETSLFRWRY